jgi:plasmid maintenance system antidote protein VapI
MGRGVVEAVYGPEHEPAPEFSKGEVLHELVQVNGLTQKERVTKVGISQSTNCAVVHGTRSLAKGRAIDLAKFFDVRPSVFLTDLRESG